MRSFKIIPLVLLLAAALFAGLGGPVTTLTPALGYFVDRDTTISNTANYDTTGTTTSDTVLSKYNFKLGRGGYEYILVLGTVTGANVAACSVGIRIDAYGENDSLLTSVLVDSILTATDQRKLLSIHNYPGHRHSIVLQGVGSNGAEIIFNEMELWRRRPITITKPIN